MGGAFAPGILEGVFFGVDIDASGAEGGYGPIDGFGHFWGAGDAAADVVGEAAEIFFERGIAHDDGSDFCGCLRAGGGFDGGAAGGALDGLRGMQRIGVCGRELSREKSGN